jgi:hypothetical protein
LTNDFDGSRARKLAKRKKTNIILNSLIAIVLLLIIVVSVNIFFSDGQSEANSENTSVVDKNAEDEANDANSGKKAENDDDVEEQSTTEETVAESESDHTEDSESVVTEGGSSPDVSRTIVNPTWKPVGTSQTGEHIAVYDEESVDWQEMKQAISYATGIDVNNMTVWFLGNNGGPQRATGTVSENGGAIKYRVNIEWVVNEGWKPVKVEELKQTQ